MNIGKAVIAALESVDQLFVVESEKVQDGGLKIMDMDRVLGRTESEFVALSMIGATLDPASSQEHGVAVGEMIPSQEIEVTLEIM